MPSTSRFAEHIGKVFLPEADAIDTEQDFTPNPGRAGAAAGDSGPAAGARAAAPPLATDKMAADLAEVLLHQAQVGLLLDRLHADRHDGLRYTLSRNAAIEPVGHTLRMSGDLYSRRLFDDIVVNWPTEKKLRVFGPIRDAGVTSDGPGGEAADTGGVIPIYARRKYRSYLKGTGARLFKLVHHGAECTFALNSTSSSITIPADRIQRLVQHRGDALDAVRVRQTGTPDLYPARRIQGRRTRDHVDPLGLGLLPTRTSAAQHAERRGSPPASVGASTFASIFAAAGWSCRSPKRAIGTARRVVPASTSTRAGRLPICIR